VCADVTEDGKWILATTPYYLLLFETSDTESGRLGFDVRLGARKPGAKRLLLTPEDQQRMGTV